MLSTDNCKMTILIIYGSIFCLYMSQVTNQVLVKKCNKMITYHDWQENKRIALQ